MVRGRELHRGLGAVTRYLDEALDLDVHRADRRAGDARGRLERLEGLLERGGDGQRRRGGRRRRRGGGGAVGGGGAWSVRRGLRRTAVGLSGRERTAGGPDDRNRRRHGEIRLGERADQASLVGVGLAELIGALLQLVDRCLVRRDLIGHRLVLGLARRDRGLQLTRC